MLRHLKVWWIILRTVGVAMPRARQADKLFRYYALKTLDDEGFFKYLEEPRTYGQILAEFGFADIDYTREWLELLVSDSETILIKEGNLYRRNPKWSLPDLNSIMERTGKSVRGFVLWAEGMTGNILPRMRRQPVVLGESFDQEGRQLLTKFDRVLGMRLYSAIRRAAFAYLTDEDLAWLPGKSLLDAGCGSGREPAEIWLRFGGNIHITGIDAVPSMIEQCEQNFIPLLNEIDPAHPPVTDANRPVFKVASATHLPFEDNSFDAVFTFWMLHWTPDPQKAIQECVRVAKPGGLIFGAQAFKPEANPYFELVFRTNEDCHGFFWREDFRRWFAETGLDVEFSTPVGVYRVRKPLR